MNSNLDGLNGNLAYNRMWISSDTDLSSATDIVKYLVDDGQIVMDKVFISKLIYKSTRTIMGHFYRSDGVLYGGCIMVGFRPNSSFIVLADTGQYVQYDLI